MALDLSYWPRIPNDKASAYRDVETAIRRLQDHVRPLTFAQAKADDTLADRLIEFGTALEAAQQTLGENAPKLSDTLGRFGVADGAVPAERILRAGTWFHCINTRMRGREVLCNLETNFPRQPELGWHDIKMRVTEYADALLDAIKPMCLHKGAKPEQFVAQKSAGDESRTVLDRMDELIGVIRKAMKPNQGIRPRWDGVRLHLGDKVVRSYQRRAAPSQARILKALEDAGWPQRKVQLPESCSSSLNININRINQKITGHIIQLQAAGDGKSVLWKKTQVRDMRNRCAD
jgi:hypothetical protein